jgi:hypothetical protein
MGLIELYNILENERQVKGAIGSPFRIHRQVIWTNPVKSYPLHSEHNRHKWTLCLAPVSQPHNS